jgi:hypothetical protein
MKPDITAIRDDCQHILRTSGDVSQRHWATTCLSLISLLSKTQTERDGYRRMLDERGEALDIARAERDALVAALEERDNDAFRRNVERRAAITALAAIMGVSEDDVQAMLQRGAENAARITAHDQH